MKRLFDFILSFIGFILLIPVFSIVAILIKLNTPGPVFFFQERIGLNGKPFMIYKFRSMIVNKKNNSLITVGNHDSRITKVGYYLRKYKLDELPQLCNVIIGDMSLVGPRPEVSKYVDLYTIYQRVVLDLKPGITDMASIKYRNENEILAKELKPEEFYINQIMPDKIRINLLYKSKTNSVIGSIDVILKTIF
jgi:lipopolysaccharide/colanic/teichoic acid biosynthesis glycosyltransferase